MRSVDCDQSIKNNSKLNIKMLYKSMRKFLEKNKLRFNNLTNKDKKLKNK